MQITWHGQGYIKIKGKEIDITIDPFEGVENGLKAPYLKGDIILSSEQTGEEKLTQKQEQAFFISNPGEYHVKDVFIYSYLPKDNYPNLIHRLEFEEISIVHLGKIKNGLDDDLVEELDGVDILILPVGGDSVLNAEKAEEVVDQLEPKIVIPIYYQAPGLKAKFESADKFCKRLGGVKQEDEKLSINKNKLPQDRQIFVLKIS